jgi:hypothetical protein
MKTSLASPARILVWWHIHIFCKYFALAACPSSLQDLSAGQAIMSRRSLQPHKALCVTFSTGAVTFRDRTDLLVLPYRSAPRHSRELRAADKDMLKMRGRVNLNFGLNLIDSFKRFSTVFSFAEASYLRACYHLMSSEKKTYAQLRRTIFRG